MTSSPSGSALTLRRHASHFRISAGGVGGYLEPHEALNLQRALSARRPVALSFGEQTQMVCGRPGRSGQVKVSLRDLEDGHQVDLRLDAAQMSAELARVLA